ncbi:MAG: hypothetical protein Cons2KO_00220 [Congregibacter sp.]
MTVIMGKKRFSDYATYSTQLSSMQAEGIAVQEVGQEWDFMLTLRLSNTASTSDVACTTNDGALLQHIDEYIHRLEQILQSQELLRSVYLHRLGDEYHAHMYSKYPLRFEQAAWDAELKQKWYSLPLLQGANTQADINFQQQAKYTDSLEWGLYGIKENGAQTAWILDSSVFLRNFNQAYKRGSRRLSRKGVQHIKLPADFELTTAKSSKSTEFSAKNA